MVELIELVGKSLENIIYVLVIGIANHIGDCVIDAAQSCPAKHQYFCFFAYLNVFIDPNNFLILTISSTMKIPA